MTDATHHDMAPGSDAEELSRAPWSALEREALTAFELEGLDACDGLAPVAEPPAWPVPDEDFAGRVVAASLGAPAVSRAQSQGTGEPGGSTGAGRWTRWLAAAATVAALVGSGVAIATTRGDRFGRVTAGPAAYGPLPPMASPERTEKTDMPEVLVRGSEAFPRMASPGPLPSGLAPSLGRYLDAHGREYGPAFRFHGVVLVAREGEVVTAARGEVAAHADAATVTEDTRFRLGSLSQQLVAVAVLRAVEQGKLALDATVGEVIEDYDGPGAGVSVAQLLSHTSGIPSFTDDAGWREAKHRPLGPLVLRTYFERAPLDFEPGDDFEPSNSNYALLGMMLETVHGDTLPHVMSREVFQPATMYLTTYGNDEHFEVAEGHEFEELETLRPGERVDPLAMGGAGGVVSTVDDLRRFHRALRRGDLLSDASLDVLHTPRHERYALGWIVDEAHGVPTAAHPGGVDGNNHAITRYADGTLVVVLANTEVVDARQVAADVGAMVYGQPHEPHRERREAPPARPLVNYTGEYRLTEATRRRYARHVDLERLELLADVRVYVDDDILWFDVVDYGRKWMHPEGGDAFFFKDRVGGRATFGGNVGDGRPRFLEIREGSARFLLERVEN